ncbi:hypothetical protein B0H11DRAFT_2242254 [Mycena galericulata]|nr:hypothetical protein B0H11DRAFT_2242254 [Mycena galericulata]
MDTKYCWRLLLAPDDLEGRALNCPAVTIQYLQYSERKLDTERRFDYADDDGLVHVWLARSGSRAHTARELLDRLVSDSVIGFGGFLKSAPVPPSIVYTTVGWRGYFERQYQWIGEQRAFKQWEEV